MSPEEYFTEHQHIAKETLYRMFPSPKGICKQHRIEMDDLKQYAVTGLWKACISYNSEKGTKFMSHAINHIKWHVCERLNRETSMIKYSCNHEYDPSEIYGIVSMDANLNMNSDNEFSSYHDVVASESDLEEDVFSNINSEYILSQLGDKQKEIIKLKEKGLSSGDIGRLWKMTAANVRHHANKAKKQIEEYNLEVV